MPCGEACGADTLFYEGVAAAIRVYREARELLPLQVAEALPQPVQAAAPVQPPPGCPRLLPHSRALLPVV